jgi:hypothetical protein
MNKTSTSVPANLPGNQTAADTERDELSELHYRGQVTWLHHTGAFSGGCHRRRSFARRGRHGVVCRSIHRWASAFGMGVLGFYRLPMVPRICLAGTYVWDLGGCTLGGSSTSGAALVLPTPAARNSRHALVVRSYRAHRQAGGIHEDQGSPITSAMNCSVVDALLALLRAIAGIAIVDPAPHPCRPPCVVLARLAEAPDSAGLPAVVGGGSWLGAEWLGTSDASF